MKILLVAQNASSRFGGEAFLPLKYFQLLRQRGHEVRLIAHQRNRDDLQETLGDEIRFVDFIPDTGWHRAIWRIGQHLPARGFKPIVEIAMGFVNEHFQKRLIRSLVAEGKADIIHQPIPVSPRAPSAIYGFGIPVVIGPMNGNMSFPDGYEDYQPSWERRMIGFSRLFAGLANRIIPGKTRAAALLVANERTRKGLPVANHPRVISLVENGVDFSVWKGALRRPEGDNAFRLVFVGRLVGLKAVDLTLEAVALTRKSGVDLRLDILGEGPETERLQALAKALDLQDVVTFHGFLPQSECAAKMARADALVLNSLRECGGAVVLEAMGLGLPVIAADWGGPADYLDPSCGILVSPVPRSTFVPRLAEAMQRLANDPGLAGRMGALGAAKVRAEYDWEKKIDQMLQIYRDQLEPASGAGRAQ